MTTPLEISGADTHIALLRIARRVLEDVVREPHRPHDEALAVLYITLFISEAVEELHDTATGAQVLERALHRAADYGLADFALRHGTTHVKPAMLN